MGASWVGWYMPRETDGASSVGGHMPRETDGASLVDWLFKELQWWAWLAACILVIIW